LSILKSITEIIIWIAYPFILIIGVFKPNVRAGFSERLGRLPDLKTAGKKERCVFCCASVGEVATAAPFMYRWIDDHPDQRVVIATTTPTGKKVALRNFEEEADVFLRPLDFGRCPDRWLDKVKPARIILVETELWPLFLGECVKRDIPVHVINGRISNSSIRGYLKWKRFFTPFISRFKSLAVQNNTHQERFIQLGAAPDRITVTGNLKFCHIRNEAEIDKMTLEIMEPFSHGKRVIVAGSTHKGEEGAILNAFAALYEEFSDLKLIIAPRHLERIAEVQLEVAKAGFPFALRSQLVPEAAHDYPVMILDTHGELASVYEYATIAFVGGSLVQVGGHNVLEPARFGIPVLYGPFIENFQDEVNLLDVSGAGSVVADFRTLAVVIHDLFANPEKIRQKGIAAKKAIHDVEDVLARTMETITGGSPNKA